MTKPRDRDGIDARREPTEEERRLFERAVRQAKRLARAAKPPPDTGEPALPRRAARPVPPKATRPQPSKPRAGVRTEPADQALHRDAGIDKRTAQRLARGRLTIDARLDLHGHHQAAAHRLLTAFVNASHAAGRRCLLVITGKGGRMGREGSPIPERSEDGVLRRNVPRWLGEPALRDKVLAIRPARPQHGGEGALYVLLKRRRDA